MRSGIEVEDDTAIIHTPGGRFSVKIINSGEIEIYAPDSSVVVAPRSDNVVRIRCAPTWDDKTAKSIVLKAITDSINKNTSLDKTAETITGLIRGRINPNTPRKAKK